MSSTSGSAERSSGRTILAVILGIIALIFIVIAIIYVAEGEIVEYASNCSAPIVHKTGEIRPETSGTSHWWQNLGNKTVVLYVGDVLHDKNDHNM